MLAHQLDLFGGPLKPPKKIKVDDDIPVEEPRPVTEEQLVVSSEPNPEMVVNMADEREYMIENDGIASNNAEWTPSEPDDDFIEAGPEERPENEEEIAIQDHQFTEPGADTAFTDEAIFANEITGTTGDENTEPVEAKEPSLINKLQEVKQAEADQSAFTDEAIFTGEVVEVEQPGIETADTNGFAGEDILTEDTSTSIAGATRGRKTIQEYDEEGDGLNVPPDEALFKRQYYSMRETSAMFGVNQSLLRFWENEFDILQPKKNKKGDRYFRPVDIKNLVLIYHLLRVRKFTMEGAKDYLQSHKKAGDTFELIKRLEKLKSFLFELKAGL